MKTAGLMAAAILWVGLNPSWAAVVNWTGAGPDQSWNTGKNWSNGTGPAATDTAMFDNTGASTIPGAVTNLLAADRTVGGLTYSNSDRYQTTDLGGHTLTINGDLNFNVNTASQTVSTIRNGVLTVDSPFGNVNVARSYTAAGATATVRLDGLSAFNANVDQFYVAATAGSASNGSLTLAPVNTITAADITIGQSSRGTVRLGYTNTIIADTLLVGLNDGTALVNIPGGGTLNLGTSERPTELLIAKGPEGQRGALNAALDLRGGTLNAHLADLMVGQSDFASDRTGQFFGGNRGSVTVGAPNHRTNMIVGERAYGTVDLSSMDSFTAYLNQMLVGRREGQTLNGQGTVRLAATNVIQARSIVIGEGGIGTDQFTLGGDNTILADELVVGHELVAAANMNIRTGGTLRLGTPDHRTNLKIAQGSFSAEAAGRGTVDFSDGTLVAYLDRVLVGEKTPNTTGEMFGILTISDRSGNYVDANSILIANGPKSWGTVNFAGGTLVAGSIQHGTGTPQFNWSGGNLHVATFGSTASPFDLVNNGTGILSPGSSIGRTEVFGNYTQSSTAGMQMELDPVAGADQLVVHGDATIAGALHVSYPSFPLSGQFSIVRYNRLIGQFDAVTVDGLVPGQFSVNYGTRTNSAITVTTELPAWTGNGGPGNAQWDVAANWTHNSVPPNSNVTFGASFSNGNIIDLNGSRFVQIITFTNSNSNDLTFVNGTLNVTGIWKALGNGSVTFGDTVAVNVAGGANIQNISSGAQMTFGGNVSLQGPGVTFGGSGPIVVAGTLNDNKNGVTNNGTLVSPGTITAAAISGSGDTQLQANGRLTADSVRQDQLAIASGAVATVRQTAAPDMPVGTSRLRTLEIDGGSLPTGTLDLNNNSLIIDYTGSVGVVLSDVTAQIRSGRNGKDANDKANWDGPGIITSAGRAANASTAADVYSLAAINNADVSLVGINSPHTSLAGQPVTPNTVLVMYTYSGDANLDGKVDADDYSYWLNGFLGTTNPAVQGWLRGDFDYNGVIDGDDYTQWLNAFLFAGPPLSGDGPSPVPEPSALALLVGGGLAAALWARRRKTVGYALA